MTHLERSPVQPGRPVLDIPPFMWAEYTKLEWYSWGDGCDYLVTFFRGAWHWAIHSMYDQGQLVTNDHEQNSEDAGYPTAYDAMKACERYFERGTNDETRLDGRTEER